MYTWYVPMPHFTCLYVAICFQSERRAIECPARYEEIDLDYKADVA
jgi:hypothetical protein